MLQQALKHIGINNIDEYDDYKMICCPLAKWTHPSGQDRHPSCKIYKNRFSCLSCKHRGELWELFDSYEMFSGVDCQVYISYFIENAPLFNLVDVEKFYKPKKQVDDIRNILKTSFVAFDADERCLQYTRYRQLEKQTCSWYNCLFDTRQDRLCFPIDWNGTIVGLQGRDITGLNDKPYYNYFGFQQYKFIGGLQHLRENSTHLVIVEGFMNILKLKPFLPDFVDIICTFGAIPSKYKLMKFSQIQKRKIFTFDNDEAGNNAYLTYMSLPNQTRFLPQKDLDTYTKEEFLSQLETEL